MSTDCFLSLLIKSTILHQNSAILKNVLLKQCLICSFPFTFLSSLDTVPVICRMVGHRCLPPLDWVRQTHADNGMVRRPGFVWDYAAPEEFENRDISLCNPCFRESIYSVFYCLPHLDCVHCPTQHFFLCLTAPYVAKTPRISDLDLLLPSSHTSGIVLCP